MQKITRQTSQLGITADRGENERRETIHKENRHMKQRVRRKKGGDHRRTSGMGLATAKMLLVGGARVLVTGRSQAGLESAQKELGRTPTGFERRALVDGHRRTGLSGEAEFDTFDLLFVNAGFSIRAPLENAGDWERIIAVLQWFRNHLRSGLYLRQLDIAGVDTKFIEARKVLLAELLDIVLPAETLDATAVGPRNFEKRYGLASKPSQIRCRILDRRFAIQGLTDLAVPTGEFAALDLPVERVFVTENEINGLAFPNVPASLVIFGLGYGLERLGEVGWLRQRALHYWGDIDTYGFHILDRLRSIFPDAQSFLMDRETLPEHVALWVREKNPYDGELRRLTAAEWALYEDLRHNRLGDRVRLEQERIPFGLIERALDGVAAC